jgi:hypothetical protein
VTQKRFLAALGMTLAALSFGAHAQTAEQIQKFQSLSVEQREAAIKAAEQAANVGRTETEPLTEPIVVTPAACRAHGNSSAANGNR